MENAVRLDDELKAREFGKDAGLMHEVVVTGRKAGAGVEFWGQLAHNKAIFDRVAEFVAFKGLVPAATSQRLAKHIMGAHYIGPEEVESWLKVKYTECDLTSLDFVPYSPATLMKREGTHVLVPGYPVSFDDLYGRSHDHPGHFRNEIGRSKVTVRWYLIARAVVSASRGHVWVSAQNELDEFESFIKPNEEIPHAHELLYAALLYRALRGKHFLWKSERACARSPFDFDRANKRGCTNDFFSLFRGDCDDKGSSDHIEVQPYESKSDNIEGLAVMLRHELVPAVYTAHHPQPPQPWY